MEALILLIELIVIFGSIIFVPYFCFKSCIPELCNDNHSKNRCNA